MKNCFKCKQTKPLSEFYAHSEMADGHLNKCKECTKRDVREYSERIPEQRREYERERSQRPARKAAVRGYSRKQAAKYPEKRRARIALGNALRDGRVVKKPCEVCGSDKSEAHHDDYSKPLEVRWLCLKHHRAHHKRAKAA